MNSSRRWFAALGVAPILFVAGLAHADGEQRHRPFCDPLTTNPNMKRCFSHVNLNPDGTVKASATPSGYTPADLVSAYGVPSTGPGSGLTVGIVDSNDSPDVESDLATYRTQFGLPPCTTANGCFTKLNQDGVAGSYPSADTGWAGEIALDVEMVSAICPSCKIMLVEANSADTDDLGQALLTAISKGAAAVSNSYGGPETSNKGDVSADNQYFAGHTGILITASAGDDGYGAAYPATSPNVLAIGGTSLTKKASGSRAWTETVWGDSGSGCSAEFARPAWQSALPGGCAHRMEADVSASADNEKPVAIYCSEDDCGSTKGDYGWIEVGGTSESSPIVASMFTLLGLAGNTAIQQYVYDNTSKFYDVTSGTNGGSKSCSTANAYFCHGEVGYDGPTGWGTPNAEELLQSGGTTPPPSDDAGTGTGGGGGGGGGSTGADAGGGGGGGGGGTGTGADDAGGGGTGTGTGTGTGDDDDSSGNEDAGAPVVALNLDSGAPGDDGGGNQFNGGGGGTASNGCSCNAPGTSSPLGETGVSLLGLGAVVVLASRRRRR